MDPTHLQLGIPTSTLLAMAAMFLGLAVIVQVIQEIYKFLTTSKASVYRMVLRDFFGSWVDQLYEPGRVARFHVRGPFQWFKSRPTGQLLPLSKDELLQAMDELPSGWMGETLRTLKEEARLTGLTGAEPSPRIAALAEQLEAEVVASSQAGGAPGPETRDAQQMLDFLRPRTGGEVTEDRTTLPAAVLLERFYQEFFPERIRAEEEFHTLEKNFRHANDRRNLRYSFLFALAVAAFLNFPFDAVYKRAQALSLDEAIELADDVRAIRRSIGDRPVQETPDEGADGEESPDEEQGPPNPEAEIPVQGEPPSPGAEPPPVQGEPPAEQGAEPPPRSAEAETQAGEEDTGDGEGDGREAEEGMSREELEERLRVLEALAVRLDPDDACGSVPIWKRGWRRMGEILAGEAERPPGCPAPHETTEPDDREIGSPVVEPGKTDGTIEETEEARTVPVPGLTGGWSLVAYFLNCLITALLVSFGAPFWDRLTDSLLARARRVKSQDTREAAA